jgi:hypothetical protein
MGTDSFFATLRWLNQMNSFAKKGCLSPLLNNLLKSFDIITLTVTMPWGI